MVNYYIRTLSLVIFFSTLFHEYPYAQNLPDRNVTLHLEDVSIREALKEIEHKAGVKFVFSSKAIKAYRTISVHLSQTKLSRILDSLFAPLDIGYRFIGGQISLSEEQRVVSHSLNIVPTTPVAGYVRDDNGEPLMGVDVIVKKRMTGALTDQNGKFTIGVLPRDVLVFSCIGYQSKEVSPGKRSKIDVLMKKRNTLMMEATVVGTRSNVSRVNTERPTPLDVIYGKDLLSTGQGELAQSLQYLVPSFNSVKFGINNVASFVDPATLRGLGPDQMLVLVNGKRQHPSSLLNLNSTVGRGTVSTDFNIIPMAAIDKIEILRDGASAQYGSDAIAGVVNIVLKKNAGGGSFRGQVGTTAEGDGNAHQTSLNFGVPLGTQGGFLSLTLNEQHQDSTNRAGTYTGIVYDPEKNKVLDDSLVAARRFNRNSTVYGTSKVTTYSGFFNAELPLVDQWSLYSFGGVSRKEGLAYGFYRYPSDVRNSNLRLYPNGYLPKFPAQLGDISSTLGIHNQSELGWRMDLSLEYGANHFDGRAINTINATQPNSNQTDFYVGGTDFSQTIVDLNFSRNFVGLLNTKSFNLSVGSEIRSEKYEIRAGEVNSYIDSTPSSQKSFFLGGANGRSGFTRENALTHGRANTGVYVDMESDITDRLLAEGALRFERYSDFGDNVSGKFASRYKISDRFSVRASFNSGFRAPSLQQLYYSQVQFQFFSVQGVTQLRQVEQLRNDDPNLALLGVERLRPETSLQYGTGVSARLGSQSVFTVDGYLIDIKDRIVVSARLDTSFSQIKQLLAPTNITDLQFFSNAVDTRTLGLDMVYTKKEKWGAENYGSFSLAMNINHTKIVGDVRTPLAISEVGGSRLLDRVSRGLVEVSQPESKMILSLLYHHHSWDFSLRYTRFGSVTYWDNDPRFDQTFSAKMVADTWISYCIRKGTTIIIGANNLFNVYPDKVAFYGLTSDGQIPYSRNTTQFGFNGAFYYANLNVRF